MFTQNKHGIPVSKIMRVHVEKRTNEFFPTPPSLPDINVQSARHDQHY